MMGDLPDDAGTFVNLIYLTESAKMYKIYVMWPNETVA